MSKTLISRHKNDIKYHSLKVTDRKKSRARNSPIDKIFGILAERRFRIYP